MKKIYLIGGGDIATKETLLIDKDFIEASGGENAQILFFPTAAFDSEGYEKVFSDYFFELGCGGVKTVKFSSESVDEIKKKIDWSSGIYLGGGSTSELIRAFKTSTLLAYFKDAIDSGKVLAGMSAGAMCLGDKAVVSEINENLKIGEGLNVLSDILTIAHYEKSYEKKYAELKKQYNARVLGIPEKSAVVLSDNKIRKINKVFEY